MSASTLCRTMLSKPVPFRELGLRAEANLAAMGNKDSSLCRTTLSKPVPSHEMGPRACCIPTELKATLAVHQYKTLQCIAGPALLPDAASAVLPDSFRVIQWRLCMFYSF